MDNIIVRFLVEIVSKTMSFVSFLKKEKINYTQCPAYIIDRSSLFSFLFFFHLIPAIVAAVLLINTFLPKYFPSLKNELEKNSNIIPLLMFLLFPFTLIIIGFFAEKVFEFFSPRYKLLKNQNTKKNNKYK